MLTIHTFHTELCCIPFGMCYSYVQEPGTDVCSQLRRRKKNTKKIKPTERRINDLKRQTKKSLKLWAREKKRRSKFSVIALWNNAWFTWIAVHSSFFISPSALNATIYDGKSIFLSSCSRPFFIFQIKLKLFLHDLFFFVASFDLISVAVNEIAFIPLPFRMHVIGAIAWRSINRRSLYYTKSKILS